MSVICIVCGKGFSAKPSRLERVKTGLSCSRDCRAEHFRTYYKGASNPNYRKTGLEPLAVFFNDKHNKLRHTAQQRGINYSLSSEILRKKFEDQNGLCFYTGIPLKLLTTVDWREKRQADFDVLSVDRIDSNRGYEPDNFVLCCVAVNRMKSAGPVRDIQILFNYIVAKSLETCRISVKKVRENAVSPTKSKLGDAGYDISAAYIEDVDGIVRVFTGIAVQPVPGWYLEAVPRSSMVSRGLLLGNSVGIIDNGYTGEIVLKFLKTENYINPLTVGERVAQLIPHRYSVVTIQEVDEFENETERGAGGFGSTGTK